MDLVHNGFMNLLIRFLMAFRKRGDRNRDFFFFWKVGNIVCEQSNFGLFVFFYRLSKTLVMGFPWVIRSFDINKIAIPSFFLIKAKSLWLFFFFCLFFVAKLNDNVLSFWVIVSCLFLKQVETSRMLCTYFFNWSTS